MFFFAWRCNVEVDLTDGTARFVLFCLKFYLMKWVHLKKISCFCWSSFPYRVYSNTEQEIIANTDGSLSRYISRGWFFMELLETVSFGTRSWSLDGVINISWESFGAFLLHLKISSTFLNEYNCLGKKNNLIVVSIHYKSR